MLKEVWNFVKNPVYEEDREVDSKYRFSIFVRVLGYAIAISFILGLFVEFLEEALKIEMGEHPVIDLFLDNSALFIFIVTVAIAPILEELVFRGPMIWFRKMKSFKYIFYFFTLAFGAVHLGNYDSTLWFGLLLITPQISAGVFMGFLRVRFGLRWAMALHACYNLVFAGPIIVMKMLNIPLE